MDPRASLTTPAPLEPDPRLAQRARPAPPPAGAPNPLAATGENLLTLGLLDAWFEEFLTHARFVENRSPTTLRWWRDVYRSAYRRFVAEAPDLAPAAFCARALSLTPWIAWLRARGLQAITVNNHWRAMRTYFAFLESEHDVPNPYRGMRAPRFQPSPPKARSIDDCARILDAAENYPWATRYERALAVALLGICLYAGLRKGEAQRLRLTDVDLLSGMIRVVRGKGTDGGRDRIARIAPELAAILDRYLRERRRAGFTNPELFAAPRTRRAIGDITLRCIVSRVRRGSGIAFTLHSLRHSFVTALLNRGVPIHVVKDLAGHRQISTTMAYTAVTDPDRLVGLARLSFRGPSRR